MAGPFDGCSGLWKLAAPEAASKAMEAAPSAAEVGEPRSGAMEAMELLASAVELPKIGARAKGHCASICGAPLNEAAEPAAGVASEAGVVEALLEHAEAAVRIPVQAGAVETLLEAIEAAIRVSIQAGRVETPVEIAEPGVVVPKARAVQTLLIEAAELAQVSIQA